MAQLTERELTKNGAHITLDMTDLLKLTDVWRERMRI